MKNIDFNDNEILHLVYKINRKEDITHRFSPEGYELLNDEFLSYIDLVRPEIETGPPLLLEVTGCKLDESEQNAIEYAIWNHYVLLNSVSHNVLKRCRIKIFWFAICTLISSILLFYVNNITDEVLANYAYLPFYFFGYRLLIYPIIDYPPVAKESKWYARLASMMIIYTETPLGEITNITTEEIEKENDKYYNVAQAIGRENKAVRELLLEDGAITMDCYVDTIEDIVRNSSIKGYELLSDEMASYIIQTEPFVKGTRDFKMNIMGCSFTDEEKVSIDHAVRNFYRLRISETKKDLGRNTKKIILFTICLIVASLVLYFWGGNVDFAWHEVMVMLLWFFGDYLIEYVLLDNYTMRSLKKKMEYLSEMTINIQ